MTLFSILKNPDTNRLKVIFLFIVLVLVAIFNTITQFSMFQPLLKQNSLEITNTYNNKPIFSSIKNTATRKALFFNYLLPEIKLNNAKITKLRNSIINDELSQDELAELANKYRLDNGISKEDMLASIDVLPPSLILAQAANESDWGRSRFAKKYNNYFGIWCFSKGCGTIPKNREKGAKHEVAIFRSLKDGIEYYMLNLNRNQFYSELRKIRKEQRKYGNTISGLELAKGLTSYSQKGDDYIASIQSIISFNNLEQYD